MTDATAPDVHKLDATPAGYGANYNRRGYTIVIPDDQLADVLGIPPGITIRGVTDSAELAAVLVHVHDPAAAPVAPGCELPRRRLDELPEPRSPHGP